MKSRRKSLFQSYDCPGLMGREGSNLDTFVSQLNRDMAACKMESFRWTDLSILIMINTLRSSDKNEVKLAKRLNYLYDAAVSEHKVLDITSVQREVRCFWRTVKENRELTFKSHGSQGDCGNQNAYNQDNDGQKENRKRKNKGKEKETEKVSNVASSDKGEVWYCYRCGETGHLSKGCKKTGPLECIAHPGSSSHNKEACYKMV